MGSQLTLSDHWMDIYDRKNLVLATVVTAALIALFASSVIPPLYEAKTVFYSPTNISVPSFTSSGAGVSLGRTPFVPPTEEKLASTGVAYFAAETFSGASPPSFHQIQRIP